MRPHPAGPNYGTVGTAPNVTGVTHFAESWSQKHATVALVVGGVVAVIVGFFMIGAVGIKGALLMLIGIVVIGMGIWSRKNAVHKDFVCDEQGLTIRQKGGKTPGPPQTFLPWAAVKAARCTMSISTGRSDGATTTQSVDYSYILDSRVAPPCVIAAKEISKFSDFVDLCSRHTSHLGYRWSRSSAATGMAVLEKAGTYLKVPS
jgi:hypothetical protein